MMVPKWSWYAMLLAQLLLAAVVLGNLVQLRRMHVICYCGVQ